MRIPASLILVLFFVAAAYGQTAKLPLHSDFAIGMSQEYIRSHFGEPIQVSAFHKKNESIWGPIESYWSTLPLGSTVVMWSYESENQGVKGRTELYFLNGEVKVSGIGFSPKGVVY